jgi:WhiB family transcriptional regulator, redox-sensing transcriptional regulator
MASTTNWRLAARCRTADAEDLFVTGAQQREARAFCRTCPVRTECLAHALDERIEFGVWGGMTERERRALLRARPEVASWGDMLNQACDDHYELIDEPRPVPQLKPAPQLSKA